MKVLAKGPLPNMHNHIYHALEKKDCGQQLSLDEAIAGLTFNADGLIPAIAQQHDTGEILMMAWMNPASIRETLATGRVCYWSRSRQTYWRKGESSGNQQTLVGLFADCDGDALLVKVDQQGPACHTGRRDCFYNQITPEGLSITKAPIQNPDEMYKK